MVVLYTYKYSYLSTSYCIAMLLCLRLIILKYYECIVMYNILYS